MEEYKELTGSAGFDAGGVDIMDTRKQIQKGLKQDIRLLQEVDNELKRMKEAGEPVPSAIFASEAASSTAPSELTGSWYPGADRFSSLTGTSAPESYTNTELTGASNVPVSDMSTTMLEELTGGIIPSEATTDTAFTPYYEAAKREAAKLARDEGGGGSEATSGLTGGTTTITIGITTTDSSVSELTPSATTATTGTTKSTKTTGLSGAADSMGPVTLVEPEVKAGPQETRAQKKARQK